MKKILAMIAVTLLIGLAGCSGSGPLDSIDLADGDDIAAGGGSIEFDPGFFGDGSEELNEGEDVDDDEGLDDSNNKDEGDGNEEICDFEKHTIEVSDYAVRIDEAADIEIKISGGSGDFRWYDFDDDLPDGMSVSDGETERHVTGTSAEAGSFSVNLRVKDNICGRNVGKSFTIFIIDVLNIDIDGLKKPVDIEDLPTVTPKVRAPSLRLNVYGEAVVNPGSIEPRYKKEYVEEMKKADEACEKAKKKYPPRTMTDEKWVKFKKICYGNTAAIRAQIPIIEVSFGMVEAMTKFKPSIRNNEGAYVVTGYKFDEMEKESLDEDGTFSINVGEDVTRENQAELRIYVKDENGNRFTYLVYVKNACKLGRVDSSYVRFRAWHRSRHDTGYCNSSSDINTMAGYALINDTHSTTLKGSYDQDFTGGIYRYIYQLTGSSENIMRNQLKTINWAPENLRINDMICVEEITGFGMFFDEGGCAGSAPDYHVDAVEVKVCKSESQRNSDSSEGCHYAIWEGEEGWNSVRDNDEHYKNIDFDPIDEEGNIWSEQSQLKSFFEEKEG